METVSDKDDDWEQLADSGVLDKKIEELTKYNPEPSSKMAIQSEVVDDSTDPPSPVMQFKILKKKPTESADCEPQQAAVLSQIRAVKSQVDTRTYEQREEDYMKARQRIFGDSHTTTCEEDSCPKDTASVATPVHNSSTTDSIKSRPEDSNPGVQQKTKQQTSTPIDSHQHPSTHNVNPQPSNNQYTRSNSYNSYQGERPTHPSSFYNSSNNSSSNNSASSISSHVTSGSGVPKEPYMHQHNTYRHHSQQQHHYGYHIGQQGNNNSYHHQHQSHHQHEYQHNPRHFVHSSPNQVYQPNNQHHNQGYHKQQITPQQMYYHAQNSYTHHTQPNSVHFNQNRMQYSLPTIQQHHQQQSQQNPRQPHRPTPQQTGYYSSTQLGGTHAQYPYNNSNNHGGYNRPRKR